MLRIFSGSPRRIHHLGQWLPKAVPGVTNCEFYGVRGNMQTRLTKLCRPKTDAPQADALVVAKAAIDRLLSPTCSPDVRALVQELLALCEWMVLPLSASPTAPGQGALALEVRRGDARCTAVCQRLADAGTLERVQKEKKVLAAEGGGCHSNIGCTKIQRTFGEAPSAVPNVVEVRITGLIVVRFFCCFISVSAVGVSEFLLGEFLSLLQ